MATNLNNFGYQYLRNSAEGVISEVAPRAQILAAGYQPPSGVVACTAMAFLAGNVVTKLLCAVSDVGGGITRAELALLDSSGARLATTGDVKASLAVGLFDPSLTAPYTIPTDGIYYAAWLCTDTVLPVSMGTGGAGVDGSLAGAYGGGVRLWGEMAAQTSIPASVTIGAAGGGAVWFAAA